MANRTHKPIDATTPSVAFTGAETRQSQSYVAAKAIHELRTVGSSLHLRDRLSKGDRLRLTAESVLVPTNFLEAIATCASVHGGSIAGIAIDPDQARSVIARSAAAAGIVQWANDFAQSVSDDALRDRAALAQRSLQAYRTVEGASMLGELEQMRAIIKTSKKIRRRTKATDPAAVPAAVPAPMAAPSAVPASAPTATPPAQAPKGA
jgi:hypothetical protein